MKLFCTALKKTTEFIILNKLLGLLITEQPDTATAKSGRAGT